MSSSRRCPLISRRRRLCLLLSGGGALTILLAAAPVLTPAAHAQGRPSIGTLRIVRQVQVTRAPIAPGQTPSFVAARDRDSVFAGQGIRTLKRSQAEVNFADKSVLRVNERTDLIVQDAATLRNIHLNEGVVWVRVARGVRTQVETPIATAVARGTVFTVGVNSDGTTRLTVLEGTVDIQVGDRTVSVGPGETIVTGPGPTLPNQATRLKSSELPVEFGGSVVGWWNDLAANVGVISMPGSEALFDLRSSPLTETIQQIAAADLAFSGQGGPRNYFLPTQEERLLFFSNSNESLRGAWSQFKNNQSGFLSENGGNSLASLGLNAAQVSALQSLDVNNVGDAVQTFEANAASAGVSVNFQTRSFVPSALTGPPNSDYRLIDRNDTNLAYVGIGAALGLLADRGQGVFKDPPIPVLSGQVFGIAADPAQVQGQRGRVDGAFGRTRYHLEGNAVRLLNGDHVDTYARLDSVLSVDHSIGDSVTVFAGRRRYYEGPVFQNQSLSQLIADRYTGVGATVRRDIYSLTAAFLHDTNPDVRGAQKGAMASAYMQKFGGKLGLHYLKVPKLRGSGNGFSASATYPVLPNIVDVYGEVGRAPDKTNILTLGTYVPALFQQANVDLFLEYSSRQSVGHTFSIIGSRDLGPNFNVRAFTAFGGGRGNSDVRAGLAGIIRFSTR